MIPAASSDQAQIDDAASDWIVRLSERPLKLHEQQELDAWRAADRRNEETFVAMQRTWNELPELTHLADLAPVALVTAEPTKLARPGHRARYAIGGLLTAAAASIALLFVPVLRTTGGPDYKTPVAASRLIALPDGSQVTLGPKSSLDIDFSDKERRVQLTGEAFFEVTHNASRPFLVEAGKTLIRVVGTKFDVNQATDTVRVAVLEGLVQVTPPRLRSESAKQVPQFLRAGQRIEVAASVAHATSPTVSMPAMTAAGAAPPGAWREGRLSYDNVRLGDVVADLNRYYAPGVTLDESALGNLRVTASFKASEIPAFVGSLHEVLPVRTQRQADGAVRVQAQKS